MNNQNIAAGRAATTPILSNPTQTATHPLESVGPCMVTAWGRNGPRYFQIEPAPVPWDSGWYRVSALLPSEQLAPLFIGDIAAVERFLGAIA
jgi:hypothetical protein